MRRFASAIALVLLLASLTACGFGRRVDMNSRQLAEMEIASGEMQQRLDELSGRMREIEVRIGQLNDAISIVSTDLKK